MGFYIDLLVGAVKVAVGAGYDLFGLLVRPLRVLAAREVLPDRVAAMFLEPSVLGIGLGTASILSAGASILALSGASAEGVGRLMALFHILDYGLQLPQLLFPYSEPLFVYPMPYTCLTNLIQLAAGLWFCGPSKLNLDKVLNRNCITGHIAAAWRFMSAQLLKDNPTASRLWYGLSVFLGVTALIPDNAMEALSEGISRVLERLKVVLEKVFTLFYDVINTLLPHIIAAVKAVLQHPLMVGFYHRVVVPLWNLTTPLLLPALTALVAVNCGSAVTAALRQGPSSVTSGLFTVALGYAALAAASSTLLLSLHALSSTLGLSHPLRWPRLTPALAALCRLIALPATVARHVATGIKHVLRFIFEHVVSHVFDLLEKLMKFAWEAPALSLPLVIGANVWLANSIPADWWSKASEWLGPLLAFLSTLFPVKGIRFSDGPTNDSILALLVIMFTQAGAYYILCARLRSVQGIQRMSDGAALSVEDLETMAAMMDDPRCCGSCYFGPVDHTGCYDLVAHHGESRRSQSGESSRISNSCPRCGWFARTIQAWPVWDSSLLTPAGQEVHRSRVWGDLAAILRGASKGLVVPFALLRLGHTLGLHDSLSVFLAFTYLFPWIGHSLAHLDTIFDPPTYHHRSTRREPPSGAGSDSCGAVRAPVVPAAPVSVSDAAEALLGAEPSRVFLKADEICCVCLEEFSEEGAAIAASMRGKEAALALRALQPPIVGLLCGHPLHLECAHMMIRGSSSHHVRCPLCREPLTWTGTAAACAFS